MCKCNEPGNCSNPNKSFGEGNADCRAELHHNRGNKNEWTNKDFTTRKDENNMRENNKNCNNCDATNKKNNDSNRSDDVFMSYLTALGLIMNDGISGIDSMFEDNCPLFDENRDKCQKCHRNPSNKNDSNDSEKNNESELPNFLQLLHVMHEEFEKSNEGDTEETKGVAEFYSDDKHFFQHGTHVPFGEVVAHIANTVDEIQRSVDEMGDMLKTNEFHGELLEAEPIQMEGLTYHRAFDKVNRKIKKVNSRIENLDMKLSMFMETMPDIVAKAVAQEMQEVEKRSMANKKSDSKSK